MGASVIANRVHSRGERQARLALSAYLRRHWYPLTATVLILCGVALRLALTLTGWPHTNSEEGTMGVEALHILQRGAHPIYLYGQNYMGVGEAYLAALAFRLFGASVASLRLGMIALYALFLVAVAWLATLLYSRRVALTSLAALIIVTPFTGQIELRADGGKAETMALGAAMFALAAWLALSRPTEPLPPRRHARRAAAYLGWGLAAGLGLYTYSIIAPFVVTSGALLAWTCRRELRGWRVTLPLLGLLLGLAPAIAYTATMPLADNPIAVFLSLHRSLNAHGDTGALLHIKQVEATLLYTLPTVTGLPAQYPYQSLPLYGPPGPSTLVAVLLGAVWGLGYLLLLGAATVRPLLALRHALRHARSQPLAASRDDCAAHAAPRELARLALALTAWLTVAAYMFSATAANNPNSGRYMVGLLVVTPAILWPVLHRAPHPRRAEGASAMPTLDGPRFTVPAIWRPIVITLLGVSLILGAIAVAQDVPNAIAANARDARFTHDLLARGVTRFYSDYWTCDVINFETQERAICAVVNDDAQPGLTRYRPYYDAVRADPTAPYILSPRSSEDRTFRQYAAQAHLRYTLTHLDGRDVFTPIPS